MVAADARLYLSLLTAALFPGLWACTGTFVAAGPTADVGTLAVSGLQGGIGGHLEVGKLWERERFAVGAAVTGGPVIAWVAGPQAGGLVAHLGAGFQGGGSDMQWWVALRARPTGLVGGQAEFFGSTQMAFGVTVR